MPGSKQDGITYVSYIHDKHGAFWHWSSLGRGFSVHFTYDRV